MLPLAERRVVQNQFWKNARRQNFNVNEFKRMRERLVYLEERIKNTRGADFAFQSGDTTTSLLTSLTSDPRLSPDPIKPMARG